MIINKKNIDVHLISGAYSALLGYEVKHYAVNDNTLIDGKQYVFPKSGVKADSRDVSFEFLVVGATRQEAIALYEKLKGEVSGQFTMTIETLGMTFRLFTKTIQLKGIHKTNKGTACIVQMAVIEPNPKNRAKDE